MAYLHTSLPNLQLPHGNLKSGNILLAPDFEPLLVDYAFSPLVSPSFASHSFFAFSSPESSVAGGGGVSPKSDVYCLGVVLLELLTGKFPSQYLQNAKGGTDLILWAKNAVNEAREPELFDPAIVAVAKPCLPDMKQLLRVAMDCVKPDPAKRPEMMEVAERMEEVVAEGERNAREMRPTEGTGGTNNGEPPANSHAAYVRDGAGERSARRIGSIGERSARRIGSIGERSARRSDDTFSFAIS